MIQEFLDYMMEQGFSEVQVNQFSCDQMTIETMNDTLSNYELNTKDEIRIQAVIEGKCVSMNVEGLDSSMFPSILDTLKRDAELIDLEVPVSFLEPVSFDNSPSVFSSCDLSLWKKKLLNLDSYRKKYPLVQTITTFFRENRCHLQIENTHGFKAQDDTCNYSFYAEVTVREGNHTETVSINRYQVTDEFDLEAFMDDICNRAMKRLHYQVPVKGKYRVLLKEEVIASILGFFLPSFGADQFINGTSIFRNSLGQQIASSKVTLQEQVRNRALCGYRLFDDEGTPTYQKDLIKDGVLLEVAYDLKHALIDHVSSTGNGYGKISFRNLTLMPGDDGDDYSSCELIQMVQNGILIEEVHGIHAGIDVTSGTISLQAMGSTIENGTIGASLKEFVLSTNIFELLDHIEALSCDVLYTNDVIGCPMVYLRDISISS